MSIKNPDNPGIGPLFDQVLVKVDRTPSKTAGGILIPEQSKKTRDSAAETGVIVAIGATAFEKYEEDQRPRIGERVLFERYNGLIVGGEDEEEESVFRVLSAESILALDFRVNAKRVVAL